MSGNTVNTTLKKPILSYMNYFRGFAILMIVAAHIIAWGKPDSIIRENHYYLFKNSTILFVFISGFLFQYLSYKFKYKTYIISKLKNVIMPYFITMFPAALVFAFFLDSQRNYLYLSSPFTKFFSAMSHGLIINEVLWFIPMIAIFFLFAPILLWLKKHKIIWRILLVAALCFTLVSVRFDFTSLLMANKNIGVDYFHWYMKFIYGYMYMFVYFASSYMLGMSTSDFIENNYDKIMKHIKKIFYISLSLYILGYIICVPVLHISVAKLSISKFILIYLAMSFFLMTEKYIKEHKPLDKILNILADYSFGIFFIHMYIHYALDAHTLYRHARLHSVVSILRHNSLKAFLYSWQEFFIVLIGSVLILFALKWLLEKCGIESTRMFIGVGKPAKKK